MTTSQIFGVAGTGLVIVGYVPQILHLIRLCQIDGFPSVLKSDRF